MDEFPQPQPSGRRTPPTRPPHTSVGLGGADDDGYDEDVVGKLRIEALSVAGELAQAGKRIAAMLRAQPEASEYRGLYKEWLLLMRRALTAAGAG